jgi:segregation and condensation protein B
MNDEERSEERLLALLEATIFVSPEPVPLGHLAYALNETPERIQTLLDSLAAELEKPQHGLKLRQLAGGYHFSSKPEHHQELREVVENLPPPAPFSKAALETAAIIAYKQPITAAEIQQIRHTRNSEPLRTLLKRKIIAPAGRAPTRGYPVRYKTTRRFLLEFGLQSLEELPSLEELKQRVGLPLDLDSE